MPELPEVETTARGIDETATGLVIERVWTDYNSPFHKGKDNINDPRYFLYFKKIVEGAKILGASRRAKNVLVHLSGGMTVIIHMKMTGHMLYGKYEKIKNGYKAVNPGPLRDDPFNRFIHLVFALSNGNSLALSDLRKFAKVTLAKTEELHLSSHLSSGPEPLDSSFTLAVLKERLFKRPNMPIKIALMNHELVAGIGNIYSDEILWLSGTHPLTPVRKVSEKAFSLIFKAVKSILAKGIDFGGDSMSDYRNIRGEEGKFQGKHNAYRKTGSRCAKRGCRGTIVRLKVGGRSAHFCDEHQKLSK